MENGGEPVGIKTRLTEPAGLILSRGLGRSKSTFPGREGGKERGGEKREEKAKSVYKLPSRPLWGF